MICEQESQEVLWQPMRVAGVGFSEDSLTVSLMDGRSPQHGRLAARRARRFSLSKERKRPTMFP